MCNVTLHITQITQITSHHTAHITYHKSNIFVAADNSTNLFLTVLGILVLLCGYIYSNNGTLFIESPK